MASKKHQLELDKGLDPWQQEGQETELAKTAQSGAANDKKQVLPPLRQSGRTQPSQDTEHSRVDQQLQEATDTALAIKQQLNEAQDNRQKLNQQLQQEDARKQQLIMQMQSIAKQRQELAEQIQQMQEGPCASLFKVRLRRL